MATREIGRLVVIGRAEGPGDTFLTLASMLCGTITESVIDSAASSWLSIAGSKRVLEAFSGSDEVFGDDGTVRTNFSDRLGSRFKVETGGLLLVDIGVGSRLPSSSLSWYLSDNRIGRSKSLAKLKSARTCGLEAG